LAEGVAANSIARNDSRHLVNRPTISMSLDEVCDEETTAPERLARRRPWPRIMPAIAAKERIEWRTAINVGDVVVEADDISVTGSTSER
jgi:hypothetical protein